MIGEPAADEARIRELMCEYMRLAYLKGLITPLAGNMSYRVSSSRILITPSRMPKFALRPSDIAVIDIEGRHLEGPRPSSEMWMHIEVYRRGDWRAVVHVHGLVAPVAGRYLLSDLYRNLEAELRGIRVCIVPELRPGSMELAKAVGNACVEGCSAVVLDRHGIVAWGHSLEEAMEIAELVEALYRSTLVRKLLDLAWKREEGLQTAPR